jgi:hypothetical protein
MPASHGASADFQVRGITSAWPYRSSRSRAARTRCRPSATLPRGRSNTIALRTPGM